MSDIEPDHTPAGAHGGDAHVPPHMPPNSFVPIVLALSLAVLFVGFLSQVREVVGPVMWLLGLIGVIGSCVVWVVTARRDYYDLPEEGGH